MLPTRNEQRNIGTFLASLPAGLALIVVDSSSDGTPDLIQRLRPDRTTVVCRPVTIAEARQLGAEMADTKWLLFTDADIVFPDSYFNTVRTLDGAEVFYGPKLSRDRYRWYHRSMALGQELCQVLGIPAASGSNLIVQRQTMLSSGGFDLDLNCNEDSELAWRLGRIGHRVRFCRDLFVLTTDHRRLERSILRKTCHTLARCALLYSGVLNQEQKRSDWGYWESANCPAKDAGYAASDPMKEK